MSDAQLVAETARAVLERHVATGGDSPWQPLVEGEWIGVGVDVVSGGSGGGLAEACAIAEAAGLTGAPAPVVETVLAALALAKAGAGAELIEALATGSERAVLARAVPFAATARTSDRATLDPVGLTIPYGRNCTLVVVPVDLEEDGVGICCLSASALHLRRGSNIAGEARDEVLAPSSLTSPLFARAGAWARTESAIALLTAARLLGSMRSAHAMSVAHAKDRRQFGRSIGSFQAVAHSLVGQAGDVMQLQALVAAAQHDDSTPELAIAARIMADRAGPRVAAAAHQAHGAIGTTLEHDLPARTLRLMAWPYELGTPRLWQRRLGESVARAGRDCWSTLQAPL